MSKYKTIINQFSIDRKERNELKKESRRANPKSRFERTSIALDNKQIFHRFVNSVK